MTFTTIVWSVPYFDALSSFANYSVVHSQIKRRIYLDKYIKQSVEILAKSIDEISGKRPTKRGEKGTSCQRERKEHHVRSCYNEKMMSRDNLVEENIESKILTIVEKLIDDNGLHSVILFAMSGMGGIGKTTIARKIFDDERTKSAFSIRIWVSISKGFVATELFSATMRAAGEALKGTETKNELRKLLVKKAERSRILLVLDDIENADPSKQNTAKVYENLVDILMVLRGGVEGSRVLITTDNENVANEIKSAQMQKAAGEQFDLERHPLAQLTVEEGWTLLLRTACLEQVNNIESLKIIGIGIVQKCNGLPLAIKAAGGILAQTSCSTLLECDISKEWTRIHNSSALSFTDPATGTEGGVTGSICLSYQDALPHLKQCFLYLSLFPADVEIDKQFITQLWISEGLVDGHLLENATAGHSIDRQDESISQNRTEVGLPPETSGEHRTGSSQEEISEDHPRQSPNREHSSQLNLTTKNVCSVEDTAERYFNELVCRSLLHRGYNTEGYKMHEQVRKIADDLTKNEVCAGHPKLVVGLSASLRRLSFLNKEITCIPEDVGRLKNLRTLLLCGNPLSETSLNIIFKNLKLLRVLDLSITEIKSIPRTVGNLVHLRHLNLSQTRIEALPQTIDCLRRLRFLGLQKCRDLIIPKIIQKLPKLEYLNLQDTKIQNVPRLQHMTQLTFLHGFVLGNNAWPLDELKGMKNLRSLQMKITTQGNETARGKILNNKDNLRNLELSCITDSTGHAELFKYLHPHEVLQSLTIHGYCGIAYPEWLSASKLPNLTQLDLANCKFCERLPPLCELQKLMFLSIANLSKLKDLKMEPRVEMQSIAFPNLEELHIKEMPDLESWSGLKPGDLPLLRKLVFISCPKLTNLPNALEHCKMLAFMELKDSKLEFLGNLLVLKELLVEALLNLRKVSNAPLLKVLTIISCPNLDVVSGVNSLRHIHIKDEQLCQLPQWLEQHAPRIETLDIMGKEELIERCEPNKECWHIVRQIAHVYAYLLPDRSSFFSYNRSNDYFCKYERKKKHPHEDPALHAKGGSLPSISGMNENENNSPSIPAHAPDTSQKNAHNVSSVRFATTVLCCVAVCITCYVGTNSEAFAAMLVAYVVLFWVAIGLSANRY